MPRVLSALIALALTLAAGASLPVRAERLHEPQQGQAAGERRGSDFRMMRLAGPYLAEVTDVIDGDTFEARVTIWLGHDVRTRVRILGIDAAEMGSVCAEERALAVSSRAALTDLLGRRVFLSDVRFDKYGGRVLARVRSEQAADVAVEMLAGGYAIVYEGRRRQAWCDVPLSAQK